MSENYQLVYKSRRKCEIYRDTGVSKKDIYLSPVRQIYLYIKFKEINNSKIN